MFERFDKSARELVVGAQEQARALNHNYIGTEHLLLGLVALPPDSVPTSRVLRTLGFTVEGCQASVREIIGCGSAEPFGHIPFTSRCKTVLEMSLRESLGLRHHHIGPEHILLAMLREGAGVGAQVLRAHGLSFDALRARLLALPAVLEPGDATATGGPRTPAADEVLVCAARLACGGPVGSHHLLEALVRSGDSVAGRALAALGVDADAVTDRIDEIDPGETRDVTPEQAAAARTRLRTDGDEVHVTLADPELAARVRALAEAAGGELSGEAPLSGPFIGLHRGVVEAVDGVEMLLRPDEGEPSRRPPSRSIRDRLRRRRSGP